MAPVPDDLRSAASRAANDSDAARLPWGPRLDLLVVGGLAMAVRLPALLASAHLTFDDGVYGASAVAMRNGGVPFRDVFSSQGPLHLPLVRAADLLGLQGSQAPRLLPMLSGIAASLVCVALGRALRDREAGLLAGALLAVSGSFVWVSSAIHADSPAIALGLGALLVTLRFREAPRMGRAIGLGALIGAALATKSVVLPFAVPIGLVLLATRRWALTAAAVASSAAVAVATALPFGIDRVIDQAFTYHTEAAQGREPLRNISKISSTIVDRDPVLVVLALLALGGALLHRYRSGPAADRTTDLMHRWATPTALLLTWLLATVMLLLYIHPLWRPHLSHVVAPLALLVAIHRPPGRLLAAALLLVPLQLAHVRTVVAPTAYEGDEAVIVEQLRSLPDGALAISDEPGLVWRAGRRTPADLVDTSSLRVDAGRITAASLARDASARQVCAVVVTSSRFGGFTSLPTDLADAGYTRVPLTSAEPLPALYVRAGAGCEPPAG